MPLPAWEIQAMTSQRNSFFEPVCWLKPSWAFFINGQKWSRRDTNSRRWRENWKNEGARDEKSRARVKVWICDKGLDGLFLNAAQRLATLCRVRSTVAMRTDVEMFNKNVYSSLTCFYTLVSVFQSFFPSFFLEMAAFWFSKHNSDPPPSTRKHSLKKKWMMDGQLVFTMGLNILDPKNIKNGKLVIVCFL